MEKERNKMLRFKVILRGIGSVIFAILFSFCTISNILVFSTGMPVGRWFLPIFVLPATLVCMTFGIDYWIGDDPIRRWSYCVSNIALTALLLYIVLQLESLNGRSTLLGLIAAILLPILPILYNILAVLKRKTVIHEENATIPAIIKPKHRIRHREMIHIISMLSMCCVLFESWHQVILFFWYLFTIPNVGFSNHVRDQIILSILSAILLAKFMKAEFVQRNSSSK